MRTNKERAERYTEDIERNLPEKSFISVAGSRVYIHNVRHGTLKKMAKALGADIYTMEEPIGEVDYILTDELMIDSREPF